MTEETKKIAKNVTIKFNKNSPITNVFVDGIELQTVSDIKIIQHAGEMPRVELTLMAYETDIIADIDDDRIEWKLAKEIAEEAERKHNPLDDVEDSGIRDIRKGW